MEQINPTAMSGRAAGIYPATSCSRNSPKLGAFGLGWIRRTAARCGCDLHVGAGRGTRPRRLRGVPLSITVQVGMATPPLYKFGSDDCRPTLPRHLRGEAGGGHRGLQVRTPAPMSPGSAPARSRRRRLGDHGRKMWITNGTQRRTGSVLLARLRRGGGFRDVADRRATADPGRSARKIDKMGNRSSDTAGWSSTGFQ